MNPKSLLEYLAMHWFDHLVETSLKLIVILASFVAAATLLYPRI